MKNSKNNPELDKIRRIISEMIESYFDDPHDFDEENANKDWDELNAKKALIALSKGQVPNNKIKVLSGSLSGADFDEEGHTSSDGQVEIQWEYNDTEYTANFNIEGSFTLIKGSEGRWGSSVDDSEAPEPDDHKDEEIELLDDEIVFGDDQDNEYEFKLYELGDSFKKDMEYFFLQRYDPLYETIQ